MTYIPERGDIVWMNFDPQTGREQAGHRPALVVSPRKYNRYGLMLVCPITSRQKGYWFEVPVKAGRIVGSVLADHIKNQDWRARGAALAAKAPDSVIKDVLRIVALLLTDD